MSKSHVYGSEELTQQEWELVNSIKRTLQVLAKVIRHKELEQVKKDIDPNGQMDKEELEALAKKYRTLDLPGLNDHEESIAIGQLAFVIFSELRSSENSDSGHSTDGPT